MITKYASKPNFNPNEPNLSRRSEAKTEGGNPCRQKNKKSKSCKSCQKNNLCNLRNLWFRLFQKRTQFFYDQIGVINIKIAEMEVKKQPKKTKRTHLWITFPVRWTLRNWRGIGGVGGFADDEDFVLAGLLGPQHGMVGLFPQPGFIVAVVGKRRQPAADGQASLAGVAE